jgi:protein-disulfide isomerase-like protein with CxxC motif
LQAGGLVHQGSFLHVTMTGGGMLASHTSEMGKEFISFITRPDTKRRT